MIRIAFLAVPVLAAMVSTPAPVQAQDVPAEYQQVLSTLGKQGDFKDNVLKVNIPRNDVRVTVAGVATPTPFGFGGWVAMTKGDGGHQVMMGDLVLLQDEVNPVMSALESEVVPVLKALRKNGLDVVAIHHHMTNDRPMIIFLHYWGTGPADTLAMGFKAAVNELGKHGGSASR